jgi:c-di-AMP phosphodiesterase-like protein
MIHWYLLIAGLLIVTVLILIIRRPNNTGKIKNILNNLNQGQKEGLRGLLEHSVVVVLINGTYHKNMWASIFMENGFVNCKKVLDDKVSGMVEIEISLKPEVRKIIDKYIML